MRRSVLLVAFVSIALTACTREMSLRARTGADQEVRDRFDAWVRAMNNKDLRILVQMHSPSPEMTVISGDHQVAHGSAEQEELHRRSFEGVDRINFGVQNLEVQLPIDKKIDPVSQRVATAVQILFAVVVRLAAAGVDAVA